MNADEKVTTYARLILTPLSETSDDSRPYYAVTYLGAPNAGGVDVTAPGNAESIEIRLAPGSRLPTQEEIVDLVRRNGKPDPPPIVKGYPTSP